MIGGRYEVVDSNSRGPSSSQTSSLVIFGAFFTFIPLIFICIGVSMIFTEERKIATYLPVKAHIESSEVKSARGSKGGTNYTPAATYDYEVDGTKYSSSDVLIQKFSSSDYGWAQEIVQKYPTGQSCEAYYNPANPSEAFLVKERSLFPRFMILFPMIHLTIGLALVLTGLGFFGSRTPRSVNEPDGWVRILADTSLSNRQRFSFLLSAWWYGVGIATFGQYFLVSGPNPSIMAYVGATVYGALGLFAVVPTVLASLRLSEFGEPIVRLKEPSIKRGETVPVEVKIQVKKELKVKSVEIGLVCISHQRSNSQVSAGNTVSQSWQTVPENKTFYADQKFKVEGHVTVPQVDPTPYSSFQRQTEVTWMIGVKINVEKGTSYFGKFPILVSSY